ncbi:MAG: phosphate acyltransferase PlsX [Chlamydiales bacterium]
MGARIGVDLMGSEQPPQAIFEAVLQVSREIHPEDTLVVLAKSPLYPQLKQQYLSFEKSIASIEFVLTEEFVEMDESPLLAVRRKKNSTMAEGIALLKKKKIDAFVSTGNTGALVATAMLHLPKLPGIDRPALLVMVPTDNGGVAVLDVGANISPKPEHLIKYAIMGSVYQQLAHGVGAPQVGLLNIGAEEQKGTKILKETYSILQAYFGKNFLGNVEGRDAFQGNIDVMVTDGFTGNVFLKTSEGVSNFLIDYLQTHFGKKGFDDIQKVINHLRHQFNYSEHPGAFLCGVEGLVIKCHGHSDALALMNGIQGAIDLVKKRVIEKMKDKLGGMHYDK